MKILHNGLSIEMLGDPHLGRSFVHGVPLTRKGERETAVWDQFYRSLINTKADYHVCMGDLFDKAIVSYDVIMRAAMAYRAAAAANPEVVYVILKGNHDWLRDLDRKSAFDLFAQIVRGVTNIIVVDELYEADELAFFAWHPVISSGDMVMRVEQHPKVAFGHWDVESYGGDDTNLIPTEDLVNWAGVETAFTGHVHKPQQFNRSGVDVTVVGSMQPYAHGEEIDDSLYVTITKDRISGDLKNKCVRILLKAGETLDEEIDCLQLTIKKETTDVDDTPSVSLGEFDMEALFRRAFSDVGVGDHVTQQLLERFQSQRLVDGA